MSFEKGFIKRAEEYGIAPFFAQKLAKAGDESSSMLGTYFANKGITGRAYSESPFRSVLTNAAYARLGPLAPLAEMSGNRGMLGSSDESRKTTLDKADNDLKNTGYLGNAGHYAGEYAKPGALIGGIGGGIIGAIHNANLGGNPWTGGAAGAGIGALGGAATLGIGGGVKGLVNKAMHDNTSPDSHEAAKRMKAEHPYLTSLPFGDIIGAGIYGSKK